jgi:hypothetical protein
MCARLVAPSALALIGYLICTAANANGASPLAADWVAATR